MQQDRHTVGPDGVSCAGNHAPAPLPLGNPGIRVADARLAWGETLVFDRLELRLAPGAWTSLLGPSGVGKTTLLRMIAGLAPAVAPTRIEASDGQPLAGRVAYMAQQDLLLPWLSVAGNVALGARLRGERADMARVGVLLEAVELADRADDLPHTLSGGQRQRVALARTLMEDRPIVLMDEPFSALDALTRMRLQDLAVRLLYGRTVLMVTHDPLEALRISDAVHVMTGSTARLGTAITPPGVPPRDVTAAPLVPLHRAILDALGGRDTAPAPAGTEPS